eukprot:8461694-Ditylum_brightwellii.AAC.1
MRHNARAAWLEVKKESVTHVPEQEWQDITAKELTTVLAGLKKWKARGIDKVHNYWCRHHHALHDRLQEAMNQALIHPELLPPWITGGVTTLLYKKGDESVPKKY